MFLPKTGSGLCENRHIRKALADSSSDSSRFSLLPSSLLLFPSTLPKFFSLNLPMYPFCLSPILLFNLLCSHNIGNSRSHSILYPAMSFDSEINFVCVCVDFI
uniref:Uncharacterized protein n=1 Tax=Cacopsylla melanoneura TaxID=428564 RepID=A0A8D9BPW6_9HEMI